jgi:subtilisin-like proprotein convertase family protein
MDWKTMNFTDKAHHTINSNGFSVLSTIVPHSSARVDWVSLELDIVHPAASDLTITLTSPHGTDSILKNSSSKYHGKTVCYI